jgi:hypothetical protein
MSKNVMEDRALARKIQALVGKLEVLNDAVGNTPIRHQISEYLVCIRLLIRDGSTKNRNGGQG